MIMGFWNGVAKAAKTVGEGMIEAANEHKALKMEYAEKSSEELHEIVKSDGFFKKSTRETCCLFCFKRAWRGLSRKRRHLPLFFIGRSPSEYRDKVSDGIEDCYDIVP